MSTTSKGLTIVGGILTIAALTAALTLRLLVSALVENLEKEE